MTYSSLCAAIADNIGRYNSNVIEDNYKELSKTYISKDDIIKKAKEGESGAELYMGICIDLGKCGFKVDNNTALKWYLLAAEHNNPVARYILGYKFMYGIGVEKNLPTAFTLFDKSYNGGYIDAAYYLGYFYEEGIVVKEDKHIAHNYYVLLARTKHAGGFYALGVLYATGEGASQNIKKATELFEAARELGHPEANKALTKIQSNKCINATNYLMFDLLIQCASRKTIRQKMTELNFTVIRTDDSKIYDLFNGKLFTEPVEKIAIGYDPEGGVADVVYNLSKAHYQALLKTINEKNGKPTDNNFTDGAYFIDSQWQLENNLTGRMLHDENDFRYEIIIEDKYRKMSANIAVTE